MASCNICQEQVPLSSTSIAAHLLQAHGIGRSAAVAASKSAFKPVVTAGVKSVAITPVVNNQTKGAKIFSDNPADMCRVRCKFCGREVSAGSITKHARLYHGVQNSQDYGKIEYVKPTYHHCRLCAAELIFTARSLQKHVTRKHQISPEAYRRDYLSSGPALPLAEAGASDEDASSRSPPLLQPEAAGPVRQLPELPLSRITAEKVEYTDDLMNVCWVLCRFCGAEESLDRIGEHCRIQHADQGSWQAKIQHEFTRRTFHVCKVCEVEFQLSIGALCRHLTEAHNLPLSSYIIFYLSKLKIIILFCNTVPYYLLC